MYQLLQIVVVSAYIQAFFSHYACTCRISHYLSLVDSGMTSISAVMGLHTGSCAEVTEFTRSHDETCRTMTSLHITSERITMSKVS